MLGKTGLILFIPSDFSWVHEVEISKAVYKSNTSIHFIDIKILQSSSSQVVWGMINLNKLINITFTMKYNINKTKRRGKGKESQPDSHNGNY